MDRYSNHLDPGVVCFHVVVALLDKCSSSEDFVHAGPNQAQVPTPSCI